MTGSLKSLIKRNSPRPAPETVMARTSTKRPKRRRIQETQSFVFEIRSWQPQYFWSVNNTKFLEGPFWEHVGIEAEASCLLPKKVAGRTATFDFSGSRDFPDREAQRRDPSWRPKGIATLDLPPTNGRCYCSVPVEYLSFLMAGFAHGLFKFIVLSGPPLSRGHSTCTSIHLEQAINLEEYA